MFYHDKDRTYEYKLKEKGEIYHATYRLQLGDIKLVDVADVAPSRQKEVRLEIQASSNLEIQK